MSVVQHMTNVAALLCGMCTTAAFIVAALNLNLGRR